MAEVAEPENSEMMGKTPYRDRPVNFPIPLTVKIDFDMLRRMGLVAAFKKKKNGTWAREALLDDIETVERDPYFKKFIRDLEAQKQKEKKYAPTSP